MPNLGLDSDAVDLSVGCLSSAGVAVTSERLSFLSHVQFGSQVLADILAEFAPTVKRCTLVLNFPVVWLLTLTIVNLHYSQLLTSDDLQMSQCRMSLCVCEICDKLTKDVFH